MAKQKRRKKRTHVPVSEDPSKKGPPKSFVFWRGKHGLVLRELEADLRKVMQPHTATKLRESKRNVLKDFVHIAGPLGVAHFIILTATENACYLRLAKPPRGPTLTMKIHRYSLIRDVVASQARPRMPKSLWAGPPLLVINNFTGEKHLQLAATLFQNMFPAINVQTVNLSACQRVLLLNYNKDSRRIEVRHYSVRVAPSGVSKGIKALVGGKALPGLAGMQDISELITKGGYGSESEGEDAENARVMLAQDMGRGNMAQRQSRVRLQEIGPRLDLEVVKVEEGLCDGKVLWHSYVEKSAEEAGELQARADERSEAERLRAERRKAQEENVRRKEAVKKRKASAARQEKEAAGEGKKRKMWWEQELEEAKKARQEDVDDDAEYYRQEVGEEPADDYGLARAAKGHQGSTSKAVKGGKHPIKPRQGGRERQGKVGRAVAGGDGRPGSGGQAAAQAGMGAVKSGKVRKRRHEEGHSKGRQAKAKIVKKKRKA